MTCLDLSDFRMDTVTVTDSYSQNCRCRDSCRPPISEIQRFRFCIAAVSVPAASSTDSKHVQYYNITTNSICCSFSMPWSGADQLSE